MKYWGRAGKKGRRKMKAKRILAMLMAGGRGPGHAGARGGAGARARPGRLCRLGLDVGRYTTSVCHVESRASGRRDERDGAPQVGGGIERGGRDSGEAFGAEQRAVSRIRDAQVEGGGFRRGDGVTEFPAERGVLLRNSSK